MQDIHSRSLNLYRNLLRAVSYFPDQVAKSIIKKQIICRFKKAQQKANEASRRNSLDFKKGFKSVLRQNSRLVKLSKKLSDGNQKLRALMRAIEGDAECFLKVLMIAYGRVGRRRRELIGVLISDDSENIPQDTAALVKMVNENNNFEKLIEKRNFKGGPKFTAFLKSQHASRVKDVRSTIKELEPKIPKENIWGRALPLKRVTTINKKWWSMVLRKLLPPIPMEEFNRLKGLSTGSIPLEWLKSKRKSAILLNQNGNINESLQWINILKSPVRKVEETEIDTIKCTPFGLERDEKIVANTLPKYGRPSMTKIIRSRRSMRRLYGKVWSLTSTISKDEITGNWITEWGKGSSKYLAGQIDRPCLYDIELFEGLEECD